MLKFDRIFSVWKYSGDDHQNISRQRKFSQVRFFEVICDGICIYMTGIFLFLFSFLQSLYRKTLQIAKLLADKALEAQACYSLGNTYTLLRDYEKAIEYHMRHLQIAQELNDRVGEGRACWSLGNAHTALGNHEDAMQFANQHLQISKEVYFTKDINCKLSFF